MAWQVLDSASLEVIGPTDDVVALVGPVPANLGRDDPAMAQLYAQRVAQQMQGRLIPILATWAEEGMIRIELVGPAHPKAGEGIQPGTLPAAVVPATVIWLVTALGLAGLAAFGTYLTVRELRRWIPEPGSPQADWLRDTLERAALLGIMAGLVVWGVVQAWRR